MLVRTILSCCFLLSLVARTSAQQVVGQVFDRVSKQPVAQAIVARGLAVQVTDAKGVFRIAAQLKDTVNIKKMGYAPYRFTIDAEKKDTVKIYLEHVSISIAGVTVRGARDYKADSVRLRMEYKKIFDWKPPKVYEMLISQSANERYRPDGNIVNSTASVIKFDALKIIGLIKGKNTLPGKQKERLQQAEKANYVNNVFSEAKVAAITKLTGAELELFMQKYRPDAHKIRNMTEYEVLVHINRSFEDWKKNIKK